MARRRDPEGRMPLGEHLRELRARILKSLLAILVGAGVSYAFFNPIWSILRRPYCQVHQPHSIATTANGCGDLVFSSVFDPIIWHLKVAAIGGILLASPIWLYQLWAFVTPGLHKNERRYALQFVATAVPLFCGGATLAYFVMSKGLQVLLNFAPAGTVSLISIDHYLTYVLAMLLIFGLSFDIPLLVVLLNRIGILSYRRLAKSRRISYFLAFVFSAVVTPSGDPFTMLALGVPLVVLLEAATQIARIHDARKARAPAATAYAHLSDDEPSPLDLSTG
ncbi:MAG: twin-arginine translocase subunit TatC [Acidothermus cellulolyticus]|jgi:sec-independent protein translocase protein TatC|nr:twin-arginine translocase subunit TatC [Acidothermus cellulolyticus]MCL6550331.1 twin-arginine translocase subunit TatC [Acidothermus cellulolyticus]